MKQQKSEVFLKISLIYIPVWIDLKPVHYQSNMLRDNYLHSSMDRFEASKVPKVFTRVKYLHSSMDRFEVSTRIEFSKMMLHLHSSMDRFEAPLYFNQL